MAFEDVYIVSAELEPAAGDEVMAAEGQLGTRFPDGYVAYITTLGVGLYQNTLRIYHPDRVVREYQAMQSLRDAAQGEGEEGLAQAVVLGDTVEGDYLFFHRTNPDAVYILRHGHDTPRGAGANLYEALESPLAHGTGSNGTYLEVLSATGAFERQRFPFFQSWKDQAEERYQVPPAGMFYYQTRGYLMNLAQADPVGMRFVACVADDEEAWIILFVRDFFGSVYCGSPRLTGSHMPVVLSYATSRHTARLRELRTYFEELQDAIRL